VLSYSSGDVFVAVGLAIYAADGKVGSVLEFQVNGNASARYFSDAMKVGSQLAIDYDSCS
jgi:hypothetical protein